MEIGISRQKICNNNFEDIPISLVFVSKSIFYNWIRIHFWNRFMFNIWWKFYNRHLLNLDIFWTLIKVEIKCLDLRLLSQTYQTIIMGNNSIMLVNLSIFQFIVLGQIAEGTDWRMNLRRGWSVLRGHCIWMTEAEARKQSQPNDDRPRWQCKLEHLTVTTESANRAAIQTRHKYAANDGLIWLSSRSNGNGDFTMFTS